METTRLAREPSQQDDVGVDGDGQQRADEEGIVPGGGVALLRASKGLIGLQLGGEQQIGINIIARAIEEPLLDAEPSEWVRSVVNPEYSPKTSRAASPAGSTSQSPPQMASAKIMMTKSGVLMSALGSAWCCA
jgi:hypothetical protein